MVMKIFEYLLRWAWDIIFLIRLNKLLIKVPFLRKYVYKEELIREGVEFNPISFITCASSGRLPEVKLFICAGIRVNIPSTNGNTALIMAARHGHKDIVCHLLSLSETDTGVKNDAGDTALIIAAREGNVEIVSCLLAHKDTQVNRINDSGDTALIIAARENHKNIVVKLLEQPGIEVNARNMAGESALLEAARRGYEEIVQQLQKGEAEEPELEKKVVRWQLEAMGIFTDTEFLRSVQNGEERLVERFLVAGMDPNTRDDNMNSALTMAVRKGNVEIVNCLLDNENTQVNQANLTGDTALIEAAREGHRDIVARLLDQNVIDVNARNNYDESALLEAARRGYEDIVRQLQNRGADEQGLEKKVVRWQLEAHTYTEHQFVEELPKQESPEITHSDSLDEISFTAMYPKEGRVEKWHTLLVYTHLLSAIDKIRRDAQRFTDQLPKPKEITSSASAYIARDNEITVIPSGNGLIFNPEQVSFKWLEDYHRADFRFYADNSLVNDAARGQINIYVGPLIVGTLKLAVLINDTESHETIEHEEHGAMYHQDDIFVSYSHKDSSVALACKKAYEALGFNVLIDIDTLRAGQVWNEELIKMIERANIFQLFWSQNSSESEYCRKEWQHALKCNRGEGFIRPVYWKVPMPSPPPELSRFHFDYVELI